MRTLILIITLLFSINVTAQFVNDTRNDAAKRVIEAAKNSKITYKKNGDFTYYAKGNLGIGFTYTPAERIMRVSELDSMIQFFSNKLSIKFRCENDSTNRFIYYTKKDDVIYYIRSIIQVPNTNITKAKIVFKSANIH